MSLAIPNGTSIGSSVFAQLTRMANTHIHINQVILECIAIGRICTMHAMRHEKADTCSLILQLTIELLTIEKLNCVALAVSFRYSYARGYTF